MKRIYKDYGDQLHLVLIHTSFGHKHYSKDEVVPTLIHFAESFARLPFPVALDNDSSLAKAYQIAGTPHWFVFNEGKLIRSLFGSQDNAQQRLEYLMAELLE